MAIQMQKNAVSRRELLRNIRELFDTPECADIIEHLTKVKKVIQEVRFDASSNYNYTCKKYDKMIDDIYR